MELFGHNDINSILTLAILLLGFVGASYLLVLTLARRREINYAIAAIESAADQHEFARNFETISARVETSNLLKSQWSGFRSTLYFSHNADTGEAIVQSTANLNELFSSSKIDESMRDVRALPGLLLSLALLLTAVGATASMMTALNAIAPVITNPAIGDRANEPATFKTDGGPPYHSQAPANETSKRAHSKAVLRQFLDDGKSSLTLAIAGLVISLVLTIGLRTSMLRLKSSLRLFCKVLQKRIVKISFEAAVLNGIASISQSMSGQDAATNATVINNVKLAIEQVADQLHTTIDHQSKLTVEATQAASDQLGKQIDTLITDHVTHPMQSTNEQLQHQIFGLRENMLTLSSVISSNGLPHPTHVSPLGDPSAAAPPSVDLSPIIKVVERAQDELATSNRSASDEMRSAIKSKLDLEVVGPLKDMNCLINELQIDVAAIQTSVGSIPIASPRNERVESLNTELNAKLDNLQALLDREQLPSNEELLTALGAQFEACIAPRVHELSNVLEKIHTKFETIEEATAARQFTGNEAIANWLETVTRLESSLAKLDVELSSISSITTPHSWSSAASGELEQQQEAIESIAERLETDIATPLQELVETANRLQQALSDNEMQVAEQLMLSGDDTLASARSAAVNLRDDVTALLSQAEACNTSSPLLTNQLRNCSQDLDQAAKELLSTSSTIKVQIEQIFQGPTKVFNGPDSGFPTPATLTTDNDTVTEAVDASLSEQELTTSSTQLGAHEVLHTTPPQSNAASSSTRLIVDDAQTALLTLTKQVRDEWEDARLNLIEKINGSDGALDEMARLWNQSPSTISTRFKQLIASTPSNWSRNAEEVSATAEYTAHLVVSDTRELLRTSVLVAEVGKAETEIVQTVDALALIGEHLAKQAAKSRELLGSQIASALSVIERASTGIFATISGLGEPLNNEARAVAEDLLATLIRTSSNLEAMIRESNEASLPALANLVRDAALVRELIRSEIENQNIHDAGAARSKIERLHETIFEIANMTAQLSRNLTTTTDDLVQALQTASNDIRLQEGKFAMENASLIEANATAYRADGQSRHLN